LSPSGPLKDKMRIYTKAGDRGKTGLFSGERVSKAHVRVDAYGDVDELNSVLGALISSLSGADPAAIPAELPGELRDIQSQLFRLGAALATTPDSPVLRELPPLDPAAVTALESAMERMDRELPPLSGFVLPGGHPNACWAHVARTVCRRAERRVVAVLECPDAGTAEGRTALAVRYLNRLSDYLFVLARYCNHRHGVPEPLWQP
jgi:cob(I)alamin adenosyltransferase